MTDRMKYVKKKNKHRKDHTSCSSYSPSVTASEVKDKQINSHCNTSIHSFIRSFIYLFIHSFVRSFIQSFIHLFIRLYIYSFISMHTVAKHTEVHTVDFIQFNHSYSKKVFLECCF